MPFQKAYLILNVTALLEMADLTICEITICEMLVKMAALICTQNNNDRGNNGNDAQDGSNQSDNRMHGPGDGFKHCAGRGIESRAGRGRGCTKTVVRSCFFARIEPDRADLGDKNAAFVDDYRCCLLSF